jgi:hydrogenase maturation protease
MTGEVRVGVLIVGIGNPDRGDDGVGPVVVGRLRGRLPDGVRALECTGDLLDLIDQWTGFATALLVDATAPRGRAGRIERLDLIGQPLPADFSRNSTHAFGLAETVELARSLDCLPRELIAYLIEGERFEIGASLSPNVADAVDRVAERILAELARMLATHRAEGPAEHA